MPGSRQKSEVVALTRLAAELAALRRERLTSAHLLAAIATRPSAAADLLAERRLRGEGILEQAAGSSESLAEAVTLVTQRAGEIATNAGASSPGAAHLLVALLGERQCLAHRAASALGVDVGRLRSAAMNIALGMVGRRRIVGAAAEPRVAVTARPLERRRAETTPIPPRPPTVDPNRPARKPAGVAIPLIPRETARARLRRPGAPPRGARPAPPQTRSGEGLTPANGDCRPSPATGTAPSATPSATPSRHARVAPPPAPPRRTPAESPGRSSADDRFDLDPKRFPLLAGLGRNLTQRAAGGQLDPVIGRDDEIERALDVLAKRSGNNPVFVGRAGVGKTAAVHGLAARMAASESGHPLDDRILVEIPVAEFVAGTGVRGALADRLATLRKEVTTHGRVVLFFDDLPQLLASDAAEEIAGDLRAALARGTLPCVGTALPESLARTLASEPALARCFSPIEIEEPDREAAFLIAESACTRLSAHHGVSYSESALARAVNWSIRYLPGQALPEKVIALADLAGARARRRGESRVELQVVAELIAEMTEVPLERLLEADGQRMLELERLLGERVVGHEDAMHRIARILRRNAAGLVGRRPLGSFLLLGPTGVGKTETAKAVAEALFHSDTAMTRIDLSEYGEQHAVARLIGAPPGYVGHEAGGQLTEAVRRRPYQVLLLDEVEKAHPDVLLAFLGVLDEGRLTDGRGRTVDFTNTVIFLTSNLGADESGARIKRRVGFGGDAGPTTDERERAVVSVARQTLAPELYNRIDEVLVFSPLARDTVREIASRALARLDHALTLERQARLLCDPEALDALLDAGGYDPTLGARPLRRTLARLVEAPLADRILRGELTPGAVAWLAVVDGELVLDVLDGSSATAPNAAE